MSVDTRKSKFAGVKLSKDERRRSSRSGQSLSSISQARQSIQWRMSGRGFKVPKYQNSYRLEPHLPFLCEDSDYILAKTMTDALDNIKYNSQTCVELCRNIAADIRDWLYKTNYDRVKYLAAITIIENADQSVVTSNGRLWDPKRDAYSTYVIEKPTFYAIGMVFAIYYE